MKKLLLVITVIVCFNFATAVHSQLSNSTPQTASKGDKESGDLIQGAVTNGIRAIFASPPGIDEILICVQATNATTGINRWVRPTNDIPCKVWVWNAKGDLLTPTNKAIQSVAWLPRTWPHATYPYNPARHQPFYLDVDVQHLFCIFNLSKYYDLSEGGKFTCKVAPMIYDAGPNPKVFQLIELPPVTNYVVFPRTQSANKTPQ